MWRLLTTLSLSVGLVGTTHAQGLRPNVLDPTYNHDRWGTSNCGLYRDFRAYRSCFDDADDDDGFGGSDALGVPEWVAYEIKRFDGQCIETGGRPNTWITDRALNRAGLMPRDSSYATTKAFRDSHSSWFARGHLQMKFLAERMGEDVAWNTHTLFNAVPQRQSFNAGIKLDLENLTGAWAQRFGGCLGGDWANLR